MSRRLCSLAPRTTSQPFGSRRWAGTGTKRLPERYWPVREALLRNSSLTVPETTIWPPCSPAPGPMSTTWSAVRIVSSSCSTTITVLPRSRRRSRVSISLRLSALVQADRRLVQDVEHPHQPAAYLGRQPDALRLAAGEGTGVAVEGEVVEADVDQELQPRLDFFQDPVGDEVVALGKLQLLDELGRFADGQVAHLEDAPPARSSRRGWLGFEAGPPALAAGHLAHVALYLLAHAVGLGLGVAPLQVGDHALVVRVVRARPAVAVLVVQVHLASRPSRRGPPSGPAF